MRIEKAICVTSPSASTARARFKQPSLPPFGCLEAAQTNTSAEDNIDVNRNASKELELQRLKMDLAKRKCELSDMGLSLNQQRQDPQVASLTTRMKELHRDD